MVLEVGSELTGELPELLVLATTGVSVRDSSEEKNGLLTNRKFGMSVVVLLLFLLAFLLSVSVIVPVIFSLSSDSHGEINTLSDGVT